MGALKVVCVKPKTVPIEMQKEMNQMQRDDCSHRDKLDQDRVLPGRCRWLLLEPPKSKGR